LANSKLKKQKSKKAKKQKSKKAKKQKSKKSISNVFKRVSTFKTTYRCSNYNEYSRTMIITLNTINSR